MPNIWTHILFCEEIVDAIGDGKSPFFKYEAIMKLGAQGPDPFFYYNFWPWVKNEPVNRIGKLMHTQKCGPFLMDLIIAAKHMEKQARAYVFGFVTHHILDRNTHPYVHYHAGYEANNHQKLEVIIDTAMMQKYHNLKTWKSPVFKEIDVGFILDKTIVELLHATIRKHYPEINRDSASYIQKAYRDMKLALWILADPHGWKNAILRSYIAPFSHQPIKIKKDYLNLNHATWHHPATNEPSSKSFIELFEQAKAEGMDIMSAIISYWEDEGDNNLSQLQKQIGNISYDTGKPLELYLINKYSDPII